VNWTPVVFAPCTQTYPTELKEYGIVSHLDLELQCRSTILMAFYYIRNSCLVSNLFSCQKVGTRVIQMYAVDGLVWYRDVC
jgi:hypothetical protein